MWEDPIVKETRELRARYAKPFKHDLLAIYEDIRDRQERSKRKCVAFPPRKPRRSAAEVQPERGVCPQRRAAHH